MAKFIKVCLPCSRTNHGLTAPSSDSLLAVVVFLSYIMPCREFRTALVGSHRPSRLASA